MPYKVTTLVNIGDTIEQSQQTYDSLEEARRAFLQYLYGARARELSHKGFSPNEINDNLIREIYGDTDPDTSFAMFSDDILCAAQIEDESKTDYYRDVEYNYANENYVYIDAWKSDDVEEENGEVVAVVHKSGDVYYINPVARYSNRVKQAIREVKERIKNNYYVFI